MKSTTHNTNNCLRNLIGITVCSIFLVPSVWAESAANAYVTCTGPGIRLCDDGLNFHIPQSSGSVEVSIRANPPYRLVNPPTAGSLTIPPHGSKPWAVESEDGELGVTRRAKGEISSCELVLLFERDEHRVSPEIEKVSFDVSEESEVTVNIQVCIDKIKEGLHHFWQAFKSCPICHASPDSQEDRSVSFDHFKWSAVISVIDTDIPIQSNGPSFDIHLPKAVLNHSIEVTVTAKYKNCPDCVRTKNVTVAPPNG